MTSISRTALYCASAVAFTLAMSSTAFAQGMPKGAMSGPSMSQGTTKLIAESEKLEVHDSVYRPGEGAPMDKRDGRVFYFVTGGTLERTFADGSKQVTVRKTGSTTINAEKRPYSLKNIGKTTIHIISVWPK